MNLLVSNKRKEQAYILYGRYRDVKMVAEEIGVEQSTISRWRREDNWDSKLLDVGKKLRSMVSVMERAQEDLILADMKSELSLLELLEVFVSEGISLNGVRPTKWSDLLSTLKYVSERKDSIFGKAEVIRENLKGKKGEVGPSVPDQLSQEDKDKIDSLTAILKATKNNIDLNSIEYTPNRMDNVSEDKEIDEIKDTINSN